MHIDEVLSYLKCPTFYECVTTPWLDMGQSWLQ